MHLSVLMMQVYIRKQQKKILCKTMYKTAQTTHISCALLEETANHPNLPRDCACSSASDPPRDRRPVRRTARAAFPRLRVRANHRLSCGHPRVRLPARRLRSNLPPPHRLAGARHSRILPNALLPSRAAMSEGRSHPQVGRRLQPR